MLGKRFARIVEECLHRLDRGENLPDVLADYPADAEQLKPLLLVAMASRSVAFQVPSETARRLGRNNMLAEMDKTKSSSKLAGAPLHVRAKGWTTRLINTRRAQQLIQPAPSYRLAMIAIVVVFGSGLFFLSASASPGEFFTAVSTDFQKVLEILNQGFNGLPATDLSKLNQSIKIAGGEKLPSGTSGNEKVAVFLDLEEDEPTNYVYFDPYQEQSTYRWEEQVTGQDPVEEDLSMKDLKQEEKDLRKAELEAEKAARDAEREAEKTLQQEELADKLEQKKAAIDEMKEQKLIDKEVKEEEKEETEQEEEEDLN